MGMGWYPCTLQWRHNGGDIVSKYQPHGCLLRRLFRRGSKATLKLRVTGFYEGNTPATGEFPEQRASDAKMFPFDDVIVNNKFRVTLPQVFFEISIDDLLLADPFLTGNLRHIDVCYVYKKCVTFCNQACWHMYLSSSIQKSIFME